MRAEPQILPQELHAILAVRDSKTLTDDDKAILIPAVFMIAWIKCYYPDLFDQAWQYSFDIAARHVTKH